MRVLHLPTSIIGHPYNLAEAEKVLGYKSLSLSVFLDKYGYKSHISMELSSKKKIQTFLKVISKFFEIRNQFDIFHFYEGTSLLHAPKYGLFLFDLPFYRKQSKKFVTYVGCDVRQKYPTMLRTEISACHNKNCYGGMCLSGKKDQMRRKSVEIMEKYVDFMWAMNPDLLFFLPEKKSAFLPYALNPEDYIYVPLKCSYPIHIVHAPTNREAKGTFFILQALENLKATFGDKIKITIVENMTNKKALSIYRNASIIIDQVLIGWYGKLAVESMMMGIAVVARISEECYQQIPAQMAKKIKETIIDITPFNIERTLTTIIRDLELIGHLSKKCREFALKWHHYLYVASLTTKVYKGIKNESYI